MLSRQRISNYMVLKAMRTARAINTYSTSDTTTGIWFCYEVIVYTYRIESLMQPQAILLNQSRLVGQQFTCLFIIVPRCCLNKAHYIKTTPSKDSMYWNQYSKTPLYDHPGLNSGALLYTNCDTERAYLNFKTSKLYCCQTFLRGLHGIPINFVHKAIDCTCITMILVSIVLNLQ